MLSRIVFFIVIFYSGLSLAKSNLQVIKLKNGMDLVLYESHKVPLVTMVLGVKTGAYTETPATNGLTHFWEHMFFKSNQKTRDPIKYLHKIRRLGISYNGTTGTELVKYFFHMPSAFIKDGLKFMYDSIATPLLSKKDLKEERIVILNEYQRNLAGPYFKYRALRRNIIYKDREYLRDPLGSKKNILATTRKQLLKIRDEVFVPSNSALFLSGDFDKKSTIKLVKSIFEKWQNPKNWQKKSIPKLPPFPKTQTIVIKEKRVRSPYMSITYEGPKVGNDPKDTYALDVLNGLLSHSSGRFYNKFVESRLTYSADLSYHTQAHAGEINISAAVKAENIVKTKKMLLAELPKMLKANYFNKSELEGVKRKLLIGYQKNINKPSEFIKNVSFWWAIAGLDYYESYLDEMLKVTIKDIQAVIKKRLINKSHLTMIILNENDLEKSGLQENSQKLIKKYLSAYNL